MKLFQNLLSTQYLNDIYFVFELEFIKHEFYYYMKKYFQVVSTSREERNLNVSLRRINGFTFEPGYKLDKISPGFRL